MRGLKSAARLYIAALLGAVLVLAAVAAYLLIDSSGGRVPAPGVDAVARFIALLSLMTLACMFPLRFAEGTRMTLDTSVIFASILLFEPAVAMLVVGAGSLLGMGLRRRPRARVLFNTAQRALQAGVGSLVVWGFDWRPGDGESFGRPSHLVGVGVAIVAIYLINTPC